MKNIVEKYIDKRLSQVPDDLRPDFEVDLRKLVKFDSVAVLIKDVDPNGHELLLFGLPLLCPGFIDISNNDLSIFNNCVKIGSNNFGDKIVININNGNVGSIDHEINYTFKYINKNLSNFMEMVYRWNNSSELKKYAELNDPNSILYDRHWHSFLNPI